MDISKLTFNPYDFGNPVTESALFVGRSKELEEIRYYLEQARYAPRPINIAFLGMRASGKTSMLNMTEKEALKRGFLTVRIDLDESDVASQLSFFFKVIDAIISSACEANILGGRGGDFFEAYSSAMFAYELTDHRSQEGLLFARQYALAMKAGNSSAHVSSATVKADLSYLHTVTEKPIILLFDECNVLGKSRAILEQMRNIFTNLGGFMLVFTGTPELFPVMDEVFSPIVRQFKKVAIDAFEKEEETRNCIVAPLKSLGIDPLEIFDIDDSQDLNEIHELADGRPYEIQLICHFMFKRVQEGRAAKMRLDLSVLEDVRKQLETGQDNTARPLLTKIRGLSKEGLTALSIATSCDHDVDIENVWAVENTMHGETRITRDLFMETVSHLETLGIITRMNRGVQFSGDEFDKIYAKYFAKELKVSLPLIELPLEIRWYLELRVILERRSRCEAFGLAPARLSDVERVVNEMVHGEKDMFVESDFLAQEVYHLLISKRNVSSFKVGCIEVRGSDTISSICFYPSDPSDSLIDTANLATYVGRAKESHITLQFSDFEAPVPSPHFLVDKVVKSENRLLRKSIANAHTRDMANAYIAGDLEAAKFYADIAVRCGEELDADANNNLGYLYMVVGKQEEAKVAFELSIKLHRAEESDASLPIYNLASLYARAGDLAAALPLLRELADPLRPGMQETRCVQVAKVEDGRLSFYEDIETSLSSAVMNTLKAIERVK